MTHHFIPGGSGLLAGLALLLVLAGCRARTEEPVQTQEPVQSARGFHLLTVGEPAPVYEVVTPEGHRVGIGPGEPLTLLNLWAPWCAPCREEFPILEGLHQTLGPRGLRVLAVDVEADPPQTVRGVAGTFGLTFTLAIDQEGALQQRYRALGLPSSYLIGSDGRLLAMWTGVLPPSAEATIEPYLSSP